MRGTYSLGVGLELRAQKGLGRFKGRLPFVFSFCFSFFVASYAAKEPIPRDPEYYYAHHDYKQAYELWKGAYKVSKDDLVSTLRFAEMRLLFEGRGPARETLKAYVTEHQSVLTRDSQLKIREKWLNLASTFLTDDGQSLYYQAVAKMNRAEWEAARSLLQAGETQEKGNFLLLKEKAHCERELGLWGPFQETLGAAHEAVPFDMRVMDTLLESYAYLGHFQKITTAPPTGFGGTTVRQRLATGFAYLEQGNSAQAVRLLESLPGRKAHPVLYFALGKAYFAKPDSRARGVAHFKKFVSLAQDPARCQLDGWDPYRCAEKAEEAKRLIESATPKKG